jgi:hypothetical protein
MTLITSIQDDQEPTYVELRKSSNTQWDFLQFVETAIIAGFLRPGDILVHDNASIHGANETFDLYISLCARHQITIATLPTYSPELNPCELAFGNIKNHMRNWRGNAPFWIEIATSLGQISHDKMNAWYRKCSK